MKRVAWVAGIMAAALLAIFWGAESAGWLSAESVGRHLNDLRHSGTARAWTAAIVVGLLASDLLLPVPSSVVMMGSGAALGTAWGGGASFAGAMLSALIGFVACRKLGRRAFKHFVGAAENERFGRWFRRCGVAAVLASRPLPVLAEVVSCLAGMSPMSLPRFFVAAAAGTAPVSWVYAWAGAHAVGGRFQAWALAAVAVLSLAAFAVERYIGADGRSGTAGGTELKAR